MSDTMFNINDPRVREHYSAKMFEASIAASYFGSNLMGRGDQSQAPVQLLTESIRENEGEISYYLDIPPQGLLTNPEERKDSIYFGQVRCPPYRDGIMTSPQQAHNLRKKARKSLVDRYGCFLYDQLFMLALSGRRGAVNADVLDDDVLRVCENNKVFTEPDPAHIVYGGDAESLSTLKTDHTLTHEKIGDICTYAEVMGNDGGGEGVVPLRPIKVNGMEYYVLLMHPYSVADLCKSTNEETWQSIKEAARKAQKEAEAVGSESPIFKKASGLIRQKVLLHEHPSVPLFNDGGAAKNVEWSRAFLLGRQALIWAFGGAQPDWFDWWEGPEDHGNRIGIAASTWFGVKRATFKGKALSMIAVDHALSKKPAGV